MERIEVINSIKSILADEMNVFLDEELTEESFLLNIGIDSIMLMTLIVALENKFNIEIEFEDTLASDYSKVKLNDLINAISIH